MQTWDERFIRMAQEISTWSKDPSTKVGCVIVGPDNEVRSVGFNGFPRGVREVALVEKQTCCVECGDDPEYGKALVPSSDLDPERWARPAKYQFVEHAERNAIYNAARMGTSVLGCRAYLNYAPAPCNDCARAFIQSGIAEVIGPDRPFVGKGTGTYYYLDETGMLAEVGVIQRVVEGVNLDE